MMLYSKRLWGLSVFQLRGSVIFHGLPFSMASASLTLLLHVLVRESLAQQLSGVYSFHVFAVILGFFVVFRCVSSPHTSPSSELNFTSVMLPSDGPSNESTAEHDAQSCRKLVVATRVYVCFVRRVISSDESYRLIVARSNSSFLHQPL
jgi:hypothetical protein